MDNIKAILFYFRMLTGDEDLTTGEAKLNGYSLSEDPQRFLADVGYCPQFDAIIEHMTGKEMLVLFCRLRGIPGDKVLNEAEKWIEFLGNDNKMAQKGYTISIFQVHSHYDWWNKISKKSQHFADNMPIENAEHMVVEIRES